MSMPENWYWTCGNCGAHGTSDMPETGAAEVRAEAEKHVAENPGHICSLDYQRWDGLVK